MIQELAERCEAATGPDRRLDASIAAVCNRPEADDPDRSLAIFEQIIARVLAGGDDCEIPAFTASLGAAMALIPQDPHGDWWQLTGACQAYLRAGWQVYLSRWDCRELDEEADNTALYVADEQRRSTVSGTAKTFALALTAAALRARLTKEDG